jgi:hypothetical protein
MLETARRLFDAALAEGRADQDTASLYATLEGWPVRREVPAG